MERPICGTCVYWDENYEPGERFREEFPDLKMGECMLNPHEYHLTTLSRTFCSKHHMFSYYLKSILYRDLNCDSCVHLTGCKTRETDTYTVCCTKHQGFDKYKKDDE